MIRDLPQGIPLDSVPDSIQRRKDWAIRTLQALIQVDSVAPAERVCQERLAGILVQEGFAPALVLPDETLLRASPAFIEDHLPVENRPNLVCEWGAAQEGGRH